MKTRNSSRAYAATGKILALALAMLVARGSSAEDKSCGPPHYCARTDRRSEPYPKTAPALGAAGSIITDPTFGSRIVRVTDAKTRAGESFSTPSSAAQNAWNSTSTSFFLLTRNLQIILYDFNPSNLAPHERGVARIPSGGEPEFSFTRPNILFATDRPADAFAEYDISTGRFTDLHSISKCAKLKASDHVHGISVSADDMRMTTSVGPQQDWFVARTPLDDLGRRDNESYALPFEMRRTSCNGLFASHRPIRANSSDGYADTAPGPSGSIFSAGS